MPTNFYKLLSTGIFSGFTLAALAQTDSIAPTHADSVQLSEKVQEIQVVTPLRMGVSVANTSFLNEYNIERQYFGQDMPVLLSKTPSVMTYSDGGNFNGYSYMRLRGIDQTRINFTLNGVPLSEPEDQGIYFSNFTDFANSVQSIQIQRGVGTSTNGTASYGGSINMESINIFKSGAQGEIQLGGGSFNSYRFSAEYKADPKPFTWLGHNKKTGIYGQNEAKGKFGMYSRVTLSGNDGYREHSGNHSYSAFVSAGYQGLRNFLKVTAFTGNAKNQMAYLATNEADIKINPKTNYLSKDENDDFSQHFAQLQYFQALNRRLTLSSSAYYIGIFGNYDIKIDSATMLNLNLHSGMFGGFANLNYENEAGDFKLTGGIHANGFHRTHFMVQKPNISQDLYRNTGFKNEASSFLKASYEWNHRLTFFGDIQARWAQFRYESATQLFTLKPIQWLFVNPKASIEFEIIPEDKKERDNVLNAYTSLGMTSREPTRTDMLGTYDDIDSSNLAEVGDFKRVKPERVLDWELGLHGLITTLGKVFNTRNVNHDVFWKLNYYYMDFHNEIAPIGQLNLYSIPLRKNIPNSFRTGVEAEVSYSIYIKKHMLTISNNTSFNYHRIQSYTTDFDSITYKNVTPLLTPTWMLNTSVVYYYFPWFNAQLTSKYVSKSFLDNTNNPNFILPSYVVLDFRATFTIKRQHYIDITLNNLTNKLYYSGGYVNGSSSAYYVQAPFNFYLMYRLKF